MLKKIQNFAWGYILLGLVIISVGISFIIFNAALTYLAITVGAICAVTGIVFGALTLAKFERNLGFAFRVILALVGILSGTVTMILNNSAVGIIVDVFILLLLIDGAFKLQNAISSRRYSVHGWWIMLFLSVLLIVSVYLVSKLDFGSAATYTVILGVEIILDGFINLITAFFWGATNKRMLRACALELAEMEREKKEKLEKARLKRAARKERRESKKKASAPQENEAEQPTLPEAPLSNEITAEESVQISENEKENT